MHQRELRKGVSGPRGLLKICKYLCLFPKARFHCPNGSIQICTSYLVGIIQTQQLQFQRRGKILCIFRSSNSCVKYLSPLPAEPLLALKPKDFTFVTGCKGKAEGPFTQVSLVLKKLFCLSVTPLSTFGGDIGSCSSTPTDHFSGGCWYIAAQCFWPACAEWWIRYCDYCKVYCTNDVQVKYNWTYSDGNLSGNRLIPVTRETRKIKGSTKFSLYPETALKQPFRNCLSRMY